MQESESKVPCLWLLLLWAFSRCCLQFIGLKASDETWLPVYPGFPAPGGFWEVWSRFDSTKYLEIIDQGYFPSYLGPAGWFPGYPCLVKPFTWLAPSLPAAVLVSNACLLAALLALYKLVSLDQSEADSKRVVILLLAFPGAFILSSVYSESLFLLLACASLYAVRTDKWRTAVLLATAATLTRMAGIVLLPVLAWELYLQRERWSKELAWLLLLPAGILGFFLHLHFAVGDFWAYFKIQEVFGQLLSVWRGVNSGLPLMLEQKVGLAFFGLQILLLVACWKEIRPSYRLYVILSLAMTFYHTQGVCSQRFALVLFPLFMGLARVLSRRTYPLLVSLFLVGQGLLWVFWVQGYRATY